MTRSIASRRVGSGEPIRVTRTGRDQRPLSLMWRGRRHTVRASDMLPAAAATSAVGGATRCYFQVITSRGMTAVVSLDIARQRWRMEAVLGR